MQPSLHRSLFTGVVSTGIGNLSPALLRRTAISAPSKLFGPLLFNFQCTRFYRINRSLLLLDPAPGFIYRQFVRRLVMPPKKKKEEDDSPSNAHSLSESDSDDSGPKKKTPKKEEAPKKRGAKKEKGPPAKKVKQEVPKPDSDLSKLSFDCEKLTENGDKWNFKISTWNVAGLRAWVKKNGLDFIKHEDPDILCLQETKCSEKKLPPEVKVKGYHTYWSSAEKEGYSGVALYSKEKPINVKYGIGVKEHDNEGRVITAEFEEFYLVTTYVPNAGQGLKNLPKRLKWNTEFTKFLKELDRKKPVILCGDLNVAHTEIDLANPKTNTKSAGFTVEEREGMTEMLKEGFVDTFRKLYPDQRGAFTFWSYFNNARSRNTGWRLDYFILSERFVPHLCDNVIRNTIFGSDHCPITLFLNI